MMGKIMPIKLQLAPADFQTFLRSCFVKFSFSEKATKICAMYPPYGFDIYLGNIHVLRKQVFGIFDPPPSPFGETSFMDGP